MSYLRISSSLFVLILAVFLQLDGIVASLAAQRNDEFEHPIVQRGRYANPASFTNWTGLPGPIDAWKLLWEENRSNVPSSAEMLNKVLPLFEPNFHSDAQLEATWIGHSTVVVTMDGATFITDPIWSSRPASRFFFSSLGPKRYRPPPCEIDDLPKIDFVIISHEHPDHFDKDTIQKLEKRFGGESGTLRWFVPMGIKERLESFGCHRVQELTWGQKIDVTIRGKQYHVHNVPAQHWGGDNFLRSSYRSLWSGWVIVGPQHRFYYSGDTGFCEPEFDKIGRLLGPFDLAAIPIGVYMPRRFMEAQHISPKEAVEIHKLVRSKKTIGVHWGTFDMGSHEFFMDPKIALAKYAKEAGLDKEEFIAVYHGQTINYSNRTNGYL